MYALFKRIKKNSTYFYVQFKDMRTGKYGTAKSIDALAKELGYYKHHISKRPEATEIIRQVIESGLLGNKSKDTPFVDYLIKFWDYDNSDFIKLINATNPNSIGRDYAKNSMNNIINHVRPVISADLLCSRVTMEDIEAVQSSVLTRYSSQTWKNVLNSLRRPINELRRKKILLSDPLFDLIKVRPQTRAYSTVGALTQREIDKLLFQMFNDVHTGRDLTVQTQGKRGYSYTKHFTLDNRVYLATALSSVTGMRIGEVLALTVDNIRFPNDKDAAEDQAIIDVCRAYAKEAGFKDPKGKKSREVPVPLWLAQELIEQGKNNPYNNGLVFYSDSEADKPIGRKVVWKWYKYELDYIGVDSESRHIVFHSLRHYFNTQSINAIGGEQTRLVMGHESEDMSQLYYATSDEEVFRIGKTTTKFISNPRLIKEA